MCLSISPNTGTSNTTGMTFERDSIPDEIVPNTLTAYSLTMILQDNNLNYSGYLEAKGHATDDWDFYVQQAGGNITDTFTASNNKGVPKISEVRYYLH